MTSDRLREAFDKWFHAEMWRNQHFVGALQLAFEAGAALTGQPDATAPAKCDYPACGNERETGELYCIAHNRKYTAFPTRELPPAAPPAQVSAADVANILAEMTHSVNWKLPNVDGHVSRFTDRLNALRSPASTSGKETL